MFQYEPYNFNDELKEEDQSESEEEISDLERLLTDINLVIIAKFEC